MHYFLTYVSTFQAFFTCTTNLSQDVFQIPLDLFWFSINSLPSVILRTDQFRLCVRKTGITFGHNITEITFIRTTKASSLCCRFACITFMSDLVVVYPFFQIHGASCIHGKLDNLRGRLVSQRLRLQLPNKSQVLFIVQHGLFNTLDQFLVGLYRQLSSGMGDPAG